jgi:hypothetical protein
VRGVHVQGLRRLGAYGCVASSCLVFLLFICFRCEVGRLPGSGQKCGWVVASASRSAFGLERRRVSSHLQQRSHVSRTTLAHPSSPHVPTVSSLCAPLPPPPRNSATLPLSHSPTALSRRVDTARPSWITTQKAAQSTCASSRYTARFASDHDALRLTQPCTGRQPARQLYCPELQPRDGQLAAARHAGRDPDARHRRRRSP